MDMTTIVVAASIPSAFTGFCFWLIEQNLKKRADNEKEEREERQKQLDEREQIREKNELCIINSVNAAIALGEATARAVQRIPDVHCNGDMHAALDYAQKVKHEQKNFLNEQALKQKTDKQKALDSSGIIRINDDRSHRRRREHSHTGNGTHHGRSIRRGIHHRRRTHRLRKHWIRRFREIRSTKHPGRPPGCPFLFRRYARWQSQRNSRDSSKT